MLSPNEFGTYFLPEGHRIYRSYRDQKYFIWVFHHKEPATNEKGEVTRNTDGEPVMVGKGEIIMEGKDLKRFDTPQDAVSYLDEILKPAGKGKE